MTGDGIHRDSNHFTADSQKACDSPAHTDAALGNSEVAALSRLSNSGYDFPEASLKQKPLAMLIDAKPGAREWLGSRAATDAWA